MSDRHTRRLGSVAEVFDGPHATPEKTSQGPYFLSISSLVDGRLNLDLSAHLSEEDFVRWTRRVEPKEGDVLFSYETRLGSAAIMPDGIRACLGRRMGLLRPRLDVVDPKYLLYAYIAPDFQETIRQNTIHGATVDRISIADLPNWPIRIPNDLDTQRRTARLLGALDDKIAANNRSIVISTTLVSTLFDLALQDTGAVERNLNDVIEFDFGAPFSSTHFNESGLGFPLLRIRDLKTFKPRIFTSERLPRDILVAAGDVVVGMDAEFRPSLWFGTPALLNQRVLRGRHRGGESMAFVLEVLNRTLPQLERYKTGTTVIHLNKSDLDRASTVLPSPTATKTFSMSADPLIALVVSLRAENSNLEKLFNALLPKLMSREIQIKEGD